METWPDFYRDGETIVTHKWDLSDLDEVIDCALSNPAKSIEIAAAGQERYRSHLNGPEAGNYFAEHFGGILDKCDRLSG